MHTVLWKRLDQEGHDACRFAETAAGWTIKGTAVFEHEGQAANLAYRLLCDRQWTSLQASVAGWIGKSDFQLDVERDGDDGWCINGSKDHALKGLKDIDLGFTPASNTNAIRRLDLSTGDEADSVAVWLDTADWTVKPLRQSYRRIQNHAFGYASPHHDYRTTLAVDDFGAVTEYPELWVMLSHGKA
ncbi:putative glycolipid-binding domain-containing protein [Pararhodobacter sp.]|uniref:putative glycolipid-binding domain-containing protein n=1 Tax=Pararhodobacter sp. TaxID=2127056 RepID=UPI002FDEAD51